MGDMLCVCVCTFGMVCKLKHLLPSTPIPSVEMGFKQTNKLSENEHATAGTFKINKDESTCCLQTRQHNPSHGR